MSRPKEAGQDLLEQIQVSHWYRGEAAGQTEKLTLISLKKSKTLVRSQFDSSVRVCGSTEGGTYLVDEGQYGLHSIRF